MLYASSVLPTCPCQLKNIEIDCLLLGRGSLWTKHPGLTAGWATISHTVFCSWGWSPPKDLAVCLSSSDTNLHPQCYLFPNLSASLMLTMCFWAPLWLWVEMLTRQSSPAATSDQEVETGGNPMRWGRKDKELQRGKPGCCRTGGW